MKDIFLKLRFNIKKLVANLPDKTGYVICIRNLKQALNHGLVLKNVHVVIKFNQNSLLKLYIDMNTDLRKNSRNDFQKGFFKLMNNAVFGKTIGNVRKYRNIKLATTERKGNSFMSLWAKEMKKTEIIMSKPV